MATSVHAVHLTRSAACYKQIATKTVNSERRREQKASRKKVEGKWKNCLQPMPGVAFTVLAIAEENGLTAQKVDLRSAFHQVSSEKLAATRAVARSCFGSRTPKWKRTVSS